VVKILKTAKMEHIFGTTFLRGKSYVLNFMKNGFATFWAIFSQTHLVALLSSMYIGRLNLL
jgi:hypothetical protein